MPPANKGPNKGPAAPNKGPVPPKGAVSQLPHRSRKPFVLKSVVAPPKAKGERAAFPANFFAKGKR
jgi:hypothetical protein